MKDIIFLGGRANTFLSREILMENNTEYLNYYYYSDKSELNLFQKNNNFQILSSYQETVEAISSGADYFIGNPSSKMRQELFDKIFRYSSKKPINIIHNSVFIPSSVKMGFGNLLLPYVFINHNASIGNLNILNTRSLIEHDCTLGNYIHIAPMSLLLGYCEIGHHVEVNSGTILSPFTKIVNGSIIGFGSLVTSSITDPGLYYGRPAKLVKKFNNFDN